MYILDAGNSRIQLWKPGATYGITVVSTTMYTPRAITIDILGNLVIADTAYHRILSFSMICREYKFFIKPYHEQINIQTFFFFSLAPSTTTTIPPSSIYRNSSFK